jgi:hypothetical protein
MGRSHALARLADDAHGALDRQPAPGGAHEPPQVGAVDELEQEPHAPILHPRGVEPQHVDVLDRGEGLALLTEAARGLRLQRSVHLEHLQGPPRPVQRQDLVHLRDPARRDEADDHVVGKAGTAFEDRHR